MMTPDDKKAPLAAQSPERDSQEQPRVVIYEPPTLVPLGNVHALLAGSGNSISGDNPKGSKRNSP